MFDNDIIAFPKGQEDGMTLGDYCVGMALEGTICRHCRFNYSEKCNRDQGVIDNYVDDIRCIVQELLNRRI